jgi:hypothetical protein
MSTINLVQGDTGPQIKVTVTREDTGLPVDLTGSTVVLKFKKRGASALTFTLTNVNTSDTLEDGVAVFVFSDGSLDIDPGHYEGEIEVTFANATVETIYETLSFFVREDF